MFLIKSTLTQSLLTWQLVINLTTCLCFSYKSIIPLTKDLIRNIFFKRRVFLHKNSHSQTHTHSDTHGQPDIHTHSLIQTHTTHKHRDSLFHLEIDLFYDFSKAGRLQICYRPAGQLQICNRPGGHITGITTLTRIRLCVFITTIEISSKNAF